MNRRPASRTAARTASSHTPDRKAFARGMVNLLSLCSMVAVLAYTPCALAYADTELLAPPGQHNAGIDPSDPPASAPGPADPVTTGPDGLGGAVFNPFAIDTAAARSPGLGTTQAPAPDEGDLTWAITSCVAGLLALAGLLRRVWNG